MTDVGPVRLLACDESLRVMVRMPEEGEALVFGEPTQWCLMPTRTFRNSRGQLAMRYVGIPVTGGRAEFDRGFAALEQSDGA